MLRMFQSTKMVLFLFCGDLVILFNQTGITLKMLLYFNLNMTNLEIQKVTNCSSMKMFCCYEK